MTYFHEINGQRERNIITGTIIALTIRKIVFLLNESDGDDDLEITVPYENIKKIETLKIV